MTPMRFPRGVSVKSAERWKTENVGKQAVSNVFRSGGIEMASNQLFSPRTPRAPPKILGYVKRRNWTWLEP